MNVSTRTSQVLTLFPFLISLYIIFFPVFEVFKLIPGIYFFRHGQKLHLLSPFRMWKGQAVGPQCNMAASLFAPVFYVPQQRHGSGRKLHPYLMATSRLELNFQQAFIFQLLQQLIFQFCLTHSPAHPLYYIGLIF